MLEMAGFVVEARETKILYEFNSEKYTGEWVGNKRHGKGLLVLQDGS